MIQRLVCPHLSVMLLVKSEVLRPVNGFPVSLSGRYSTDYYDFAALSVTLAINQPTPKGRIQFRRCSHSNLPVDLGVP
jgi:hypothetical protein